MSRKPRLCSEAKEVLGDLKNFKWFSRVGQAVPKNLQKDVVVASCWSEALHGCRSRQWFNVRAEQLRLMWKLPQQNGESVSDSWNEIGDTIRETSSPVLRPLMARHLEPFGLKPRHALPSLSWSPPTSFVP
jgi:hypothetical protein